MISEWKKEIPMNLFTIIAGKFARQLYIAVALGFGLISPVQAAHQPQATGSFDAQQSGDIEEIVRNFILAHPEVIAEAINKLNEQQQQAEELANQAAAKAVKPVTVDDHTLGNPSAPVKLIEFSDFECPFCKRFHPTVEQVIDEYGKSGKVLVIYRHFPLDELHSKARKEAQAAECANEIGGNDAFWAYANKIFEITPSNDRLDLAHLPQIAKEIGLDRSKFEACLAGDMRGGKYADHIEANYQDAIASGGKGTPYSLVISAKGQIFPINGAQPYEAVKAIIDVALKDQ